MGEAIRFASDPRRAYSVEMRTTQATENTNKAIGILILTMAVFAVQDAITKYLAQNYAVPQILMVRYIFLAVFAMFLARGRGKLRNSFRAARPWLQILRSLFIVVEIGVFALAIRYLPLADTHALMASCPLIVTALSFFILKEQVGIRRWSAVFVGFVGVIVILRPGFQAVEPAMLIALTAAGLFAVYNILTKIVSRDDDPETSLLYMGLVGAAVLSVVGPFFWVSPDGWDWVLLLVLGLTGTVGHLMLITALEMAPASVLQPFNYLMLVFASIVGFLVFGNVPDGYTVLGAGIVVGSGLYVFYRERQRAAAEKRRVPASGKVDTSVG